MNKIVEMWNSFWESLIVGGKPNKAALTTLKEGFVNRCKVFKVCPQRVKFDFSGKIVFDVAGEGGTGTATITGGNDFDMAYDVSTGKYTMKLAFHGLKTIIEVDAHTLVEYVVNNQIVVTYYR